MSDTSGFDLFKLPDDYDEMTERERLRWVQSLIEGMTDRDDDRYDTD